MKSHRFDGLSFVAGVMTTLVGLAFLLPRTWADLTWMFGRMASWIWPVIFLVLGLAVLLPALMPKEKKPEKTQEV